MYRGINLVEWILFLWLVNRGMANTRVRICDSPVDSNAAPSIYTNYIKKLYELKFSARSTVLPQDCLEFSNNIDVTLDYMRIECQEIKQNIENMKLGVGLHVNWPDDYLVQTMNNRGDLESEEYEPYTKQIISVKMDTVQPQHNFMSKTAQTTVWTTVMLERPAAYSSNLTNCFFNYRKSAVNQKPEAYDWCIHPFYRLYDDFFDKPLTFSSTGFESGERGLAGYIHFDKRLFSGKNKKIVQMKNPDGRVVSGVSMAACAPPEFHIQFHWQKEELFQCNKPVITITDIRESNNFDCRLPFTTNRIRSSVPIAFTLQQSRDQVVATLTKYTYAVSKIDSTKVILFSNMQSQNIAQCIFSDNTRVSLKWDEWSATTPGKCAVCASGRGGSTVSRIPRACNMSSATERNMDCCFDCARGFNLLRFQDKQHCVKACPEGSAYDSVETPTPICIACPAGKYTRPKSGGMGGCWTCSAMGEQNAIVNPRRGGCVSCGSRHVASSSNNGIGVCRPCNPMEYVPEKGTECRKCPEGERLISAESTVCTPCSAGFKMDSSGNCILCPLQMFKSSAGKGDCIACPRGTRSLPNRSACVPCEGLNTTLAPYAVYSPSGGCDVICNRMVSYAHTSNPYAQDGCRPCTDRPPPIGMYPMQDDCSSFLPCTNAPPSMAEYTTGGSMGKSDSCQWVCTRGFTASSNKCVACHASGFDPTLHVYTDGCHFACLPGLYYRGPDNRGTSCTQRCTNLLTTPGTVFPLLTDYYRIFLHNASIVNRRLRPNFIMGHCGSDTKAPDSEISLLRNVGIYGFPSVDTVNMCGNSILNTAEECDDGNRNNGDGCSASCKIEQTGFWDCGLIGAKCKEMCGWNEQPTREQPVGLIGFKFDPREAIRKNMPWCTGVSYHADFSLVPIAYKMQWMQENLVPCNCEQQPMQTLPYSECNYTNHGCRKCHAGEYMDDLYSRCARCGSACAIGFRPFDAVLDMANTDTNAEIKSRFQFDSLGQCGPSISTSMDLTYADPVDDPFRFGRDQIMIGCVPCTMIAPNTLSRIVFVQGNNAGGGGGGTCNWMCKRDPANQTDPDYYCATSNGTVCNGPCLLCDDSLRDVRRRAATALQVGLYITPCMDRDGHTLQRCNNLASIANARYTGNSLEVVGDQGGCPWACNAGFERFEDACRRCMPRSSLRCANGETAVLCPSTSGQLYCAPCTAVMKGVAELKIMEVWRSEGPFYTSCIPECESGIAFKTNASDAAELCQQCTQQLCEIGEEFIDCTPTNDSRCSPCSDDLPANEEFYIRGVCSRRCMAGHARVGDNRLCSLCSEKHCGLGFRKEHSCMDPSEREGGLPVCVPCAINEPLNLATDGRVWLNDATECRTSCKPGWMVDNAAKRNLTCVPCSYGACPVGFEAECMGGLQSCVPCPQISSLSNMKYAGAGNCSRVCVSTQFALPFPDATYCVAVASEIPVDGGSITGPTVVVERGVDLLAITRNGTSANGFPVRSMPHSAYNP